MDELTLVYGLIGAANDGTSLNHLMVAAIVIPKVFFFFTPNF